MLVLAELFSFLQLLFAETILYKNFNNKLKQVKRSMQDTCAFIYTRTVLSQKIAWLNFNARNLSQDTLAFLETLKDWRERKILKNVNSAPGPFFFIKRGGQVGEGITGPLGPSIRSLVNRIQCQC